MKKYCIIYFKNKHRYSREMYALDMSDAIIKSCVYLEIRQTDITSITEL